MKTPLRVFWKAIGAIGLLSAPVWAGDIIAVPCVIIRGVMEALQRIAPAIIMLMFLYGAARYAYSADDPGGRKQGKNILIHTLIGSLIIGLIISIIATMGIATQLCW
jgi:hypothetical protein